MTAPSLEALGFVFRLKHGEPDQTGVAPRRRWRFGYFTPDDVYEGLVAEYAKSGMRWIDVGGGRAIFPTNPKLAQMLVQRCEEVVGLDPSDNIDENPFVHRRVRTTIERYQDDRPYDLVTMRMVAEHVADPHAAVAALAALTKPGGKVVVLTVNRWAPVSIASWLVPFRLHHLIKRALWRTEEKDTFPVAYRMNTRRELRRLFDDAGFREHSFCCVADCCVLHRIPLFNWIELCLWRAFKALSLPYPETCLLGVYERT